MQLATAPRNCIEHTIKENLRERAWWRRAFYVPMHSVTPLPGIVVKRYRRPEALRPQLSPGLPLSCGGDYAGKLFLGKP